MSNLKDIYQDTIVAQATALGRGGVGIIRISGAKAIEVARSILKFEPKARFAHYCPFYDMDDQIVDEGVALFFPAPNSFTGENVLELHGHGGPIILDMLLKTAVAIGARQARPGEFSERAFLNDKLDLAQAEAIADLIESSSEQAARSALRSLQGVFSQRINELIESLIELRIYVEAAIDFPEEEIDFLKDSKVISDLDNLFIRLNKIIREANQGAILRDGMTVVIAGRPNAGKSSLMNILAEKDAAIVTDIAGTTRDVLKEYINIDGMPIHMIDTAGLRESSDKVEQIGIDRAFKAIKEADRVLLVVDAVSTDVMNDQYIKSEFIDNLKNQKKLTIIRNKIDITGDAPNLFEVNGIPVINLCACNEKNDNQGIDILRNHLKECMGFDGAIEGNFSARRRHLEALQKAKELVENGQQQLENLGAGELLAEDLRLAQKHLEEITGVFTSDELLGRIFSSFCIGK